MLLFSNDTTSFMDSLSLMIKVLCLHSSMIWLEKVTARYIPILNDTVEINIVSSNHDCKYPAKPVTYKLWCWLGAVAHSTKLN